MRPILYARVAGAGALLLGSTAPAPAQTADPARSRAYVGAEATVETRVVVAGGVANGTGVYLAGGTFFGGYALTPALTLQAGLAHARGGSMDDNFADDGTPKYVAETYEATVWGLPLGLRLRLSQPTRRLQVEALAGLSLYHIQQTQTYNRLKTQVSTDGWTPIVSHDRAVNGYLNLGLGLRYSFSPSWSIGSDILLNGNVRHTGYFGIGPGAGATPGVRHHFH